MTTNQFGEMFSTLAFMLTRVLIKVRWLARIHLGVWVSEYALAHFQHEQAAQWVRVTKKVENNISAPSRVTYKINLATEVFSYHPKGARHPPEECCNSGTKPKLKSTRF